MTTPIQQAAFEELSQGGGFFNHIAVRCEPMTTSDLFEIVSVTIPAITDPSPVPSNCFYQPHLFGVPPLTGPQITLVNNFRIALFNSLRIALLEFNNDYQSIEGRQEDPQEDPLFALNAIPGVTAGSTAGSLIEHTNKYFGDKRGAPSAYYKTGLPPLLIKFASAKSVNDVMTALEQTVYPTNNVTLPIINVVTGAGGQWIIAGDFTSTFLTGSTFLVTGNSGNGVYSVGSSVFALGNTTITIPNTETIPLAATPTGNISNVFPAGYFSVTFPLINAAPFRNASVPLLPGNTWYDEMVGTISGAIYSNIDSLNDYYSVTIPTNHPTFVSTVQSLLNNIVSTIASITNFTTFTSNSPQLTTDVQDISDAYTAVVTADPHPTADRERIDAQIIQENLRYYGHSFVMLNQGSVSTGFYQYKNDPNAYPILEDCSTPTMLAALNEIITPS